MSLSISKHGKACAKCRKIKPLDNFHKCGQHKDGLSSYCKQCRAEHNRLNKSYKKEYMKKYYLNNKDKRKRYLENNKDRIISKRREYYVKNRDKLRAYSRKISFKSHLKYKYGISLEEYNKKLEQQGGVCKICKQTYENDRLQVDHNHTTGEIRGLLCRKCNVAVGFIEDTILTENVLKYLQEYDK